MKLKRYPDGSKSFVTDSKADVVLFYGWWCECVKCVESPKNEGVFLKKKRK